MFLIFDLEFVFLAFVAIFSLKKGVKKRSVGKIQKGEIQNVQ